jgi:hypothetical protein
MKADVFWQELPIEPPARDFEKAEGLLRNKVQESDINLEIS